MPSKLDGSQKGASNVTTIVDRRTDADAVYTDVDEGVT